MVHVAISMTCERCEDYRRESTKNTMSEENASSRLANSENLSRLIGRRKRSFLRSVKRDISKVERIAAIYLREILGY